MGRADDVIDTVVQEISALSRAVHEEDGGVHSTVRATYSRVEQGLPSKDLTPGETKLYIFEYLTAAFAAIIIAFVVFLYWYAGSDSLAELGHSLLKPDKIICTAAGLVGATTGIVAKTVDSRLPWRLTPWGAVSLSLLAGAWASTLITDFNAANDGDKRRTEIHGIINDMKKEVDGMTINVDNLNPAVDKLLTNVANANSSLEQVATKTADSLDRDTVLANNIAGKVKTASPKDIADQVKLPDASDIAKKVVLPSASEIADDVKIPSPGDIASHVAVNVPSASEIASHVTVNVPTAGEIAQKIEIPSASEIASHLTVNAPSATDIATQLATQIKVPSAEDIAASILQQQNTTTCAQMRSASPAPSHDVLVFVATYCK